MHAEENDIIEYEQIDKSKCGKLLRQYLINVPLSHSHMHPRIFRALLNLKIGEQVDVTFSKEELGNRSKERIHEVPISIIKHFKSLQKGMLVKCKYLDNQMWGKIVSVDQTKNKVIIDFNSLAADSDGQYSSFIVKSIIKKSDWAETTVPNKVRIMLNNKEIKIW